MSREAHVQFCESLGVRFPGATHRVITCKSAAEARSAVDAARLVLKQLGVEFHPQKRRIDFSLGYAYSASRRARLQILLSGRCSFLIDQIRQRTKRTMPLKTEELIAELNPLLRGRGETQLSLRDIARQLNPLRRGWVEYYGRYASSALYPLLRHINQIFHPFSI